MNGQMLFLFILDQTNLETSQISYTAFMNPNRTPYKI